MNMFLEEKGVKLTKLFLARKKALSACIHFLLLLKTFLKSVPCAKLARMFWVVARVLLRYSEQVLTCYSVVARMF